MEDIIESIPKTMEKFLGCAGQMVKPSPDTVEALVGKIKKGKLATISQLREKIARDFNVDTACPAATLKALQLISKKEQPNCFWRIVKEKGELISKFPNGVEGHAEHLQSEGHQIDFSKKVPVVAGYESKLSKSIIQSNQTTVYRNVKLQGELMSILYLVKKNNEFVSFCTCQEGLVGDPGQLDCPWCGCGWLFSCTKCRKAFSFAVATEIEKTWEEIAAEDIYNYSNKQPAHEEILEWVGSMKSMQSEIKLGKTYVYFDGAFVPAEEENFAIEGWYAKHEFAKVPQVAALKDSEIKNLVLSNPEYWRNNRI